VLFALLVACHRAVPPTPSAEPSATPAASAPVASAERIAVQDLRSLACDASICLAITGTSLARVDLEPLALTTIASLAQTGTLVTDEQGWALVHACDTRWCRASLDPETGALGADASLPTPVPAFPSDATALATRWNAMIAKGWRSPFQTRLPSPGGGVVSYLRGLEPSSAQLMRTGPTPAIAPAPAATEPASYPGWLALHPTGREAYVLVWPGGELRAIDPARLGERWRLALRPGAHGLFVDPGGRYLLAEQAGEVTHDRFVDFDVETIGAGADPTGDAELALRARPPGAETVAIDLARHEPALTLDGPYVAWVPRGTTSFVVATRTTIALLRQDPKPN
jgi:hypothetical protein